MLIAWNIKIAITEFDSDSMNTIAVNHSKFRLWLVKTNFPFAMAKLSIYIEFLKCDMLKAAAIKILLHLSEFKYPIQQLKIAYLQYI